MKNLKGLRVNSGKTQEEMAEMLGIDRITYHRYERGLRQPPVEIMIKLADYFEVSLDYLLGRTEAVRLTENGITDVAAHTPAGEEPVTMDYLHSKLDEIMKEIDKFKNSK